MHICAVAFGEFCAGRERNGTYFGLVGAPTAFSIYRRKALWLPNRAARLQKAFTYPGKERSQLLIKGCAVQYTNTYVVGEGGGGGGRHKRRRRSHKQTDRKTRKKGEKAPSSAFVLLSYPHRQCEKQRQEGE